MFRLPAELRVGPRRVGCEVQHVARAARRNLVRHVPADGVRKCPDHLVHCAALASAQVPGAHPGVVGEEVVQGFEVAVGEVQNVDVVADSGAVARVVVYSSVCTLKD